MRLHPIYLVGGAIIWVLAYKGFRSPRRFQGQFRESPIFAPRSRRVSIILATIASALMLSYCVYNAPD